MELTLVFHWPGDDGEIILSGGLEVGKDGLDAVAYVSLDGDSVMHFYS